jgi:type IV secretion system protein VirB3
MEVFLLTKNLLTLLIVIPIHGVCALLCLRDARYFDLILLWGRTRLPAFTGTYRIWKASSFSPLELNAPSINGRRRRIANQPRFSYARARAETFGGSPRKGK